MLYIVCSMFVGVLGGGFFLGVPGSVMCTIGLMLTYPKIISDLSFQFGVKTDLLRSEQVSSFILMVFLLLSNTSEFGVLEFSVRENFTYSNNYFGFENDRIVNWTFSSIFFFMVCRIMYRIFYCNYTCIAYLKKTIYEISPTPEGQIEIPQFLPVKVKIRLFFKFIMSIVLLPVMFYAHYDALEMYFNGVHVGGRIGNSFYALYQYEFLIILWITAISYTISVCTSALLDSFILFFKKYFI